MDYFEAGFIIDILLKGVALKWVRFRFLLEGVWRELGDIRPIGGPKCILQILLSGMSKVDLVTLWSLDVQSFS